MSAEPARGCLFARGFESDGKTELLKLLNVAFDGSIFVSLVVEVRTEIVVLLIAGEQVVDDDQDLTGGGDDGFVSTDSETQTVETAAQEAVFFSRCSPCDLNADAFEIAISFRHGDVATFVGTDAVAGG